MENMNDHKLLPKLAFAICSLCNYLNMKTNRSHLKQMGYICLLLSCKLYERLEHTRLHQHKETLQWIATSNAFIKS